MHIDADRHFRKLRWHPSNVGKNLQGTAIATYPMIKMPDDVSLPQENANSSFIPIFSPARPNDQFSRIARPWRGG